MRELGCDPTKQMEDEIMRTRNALLAVMVVFLFCSVVLAEKPPEAGTTGAELAKLQLPQPSTVKVLVIPLWDYTSDIFHQRTATAGVYQRVEHEGFNMLPILKGFEVVRADSELEPGLPLRKAEAIRLGKAAGADWAVYGEVRELRVYEKSKFLGSTKKIICSMRLAIVDCNKGEVIYWKERSDTLGDSGLLARKSTKLIRVGVQSVSNNILTPLFTAMPKHEVKGAVPDDAALLEFEKKMWPEGGD